MKPTMVLDGLPGPTVRIDVTDVAQQFLPAYCTRNGKTAIGALILCEDNNIRFGLGGTDPTQGLLPVGMLLFANQSIKLSNPVAVRTFSYINAVAATNGTLQVVFEFEPGA